MENKEKFIKIDNQLMKTKSEYEDEKKILIDQLDNLKEEEVVLNMNISFFEDLLENLNQGRYKDNKLSNE